MTERKSTKTTVEAARMGGVYSFWPHELVMITDPKDKLYDQHIEEEIPDGAVVNVAAHGILQTARVVRRDGEPIVIAGHQRTKRAHVVNHIVSVRKYDGTLKSVRDSIKRIEGNEELVRRILQLAPKGVKVPAIVSTRTDEAHARAIKVAEQVWRRKEDPVAIQADEAQRMTELGFSVEDIATEMNISAATVRRYLKFDTSKPRERKKRGKATRPGAKQIQVFFAKVKDKLNKRERLLLEWILEGGSGVDCENAFGIE